MQDFKNILLLHCSCMFIHLHTWANKSINNGPILLQTIPIPVHVKNNWAWTGIIFDWLILFKDLCFSGLFERTFLDSQQPIIVYEVSWLNFDNVPLYHVPFYLWRKSRSTESRIKSVSNSSGDQNWRNLWFISLKHTKNCIFSRLYLPKIILAQCPPSLFISS